MAVKTRNRQRTGLANTTQLFMNQIIVPEVTKLTKDDHYLVNFLDRSVKPQGDVSKKLKGRDCCWTVKFQIATIPTKDVTPALHEAMAKAAPGDWESLNIDICELIYHHEGICDFMTINVVAAKIFMTYFESHTYLLDGIAKFQPIELTERLSTVGRFKTTIDRNDDFDINFFYYPSIANNNDFVNRPFTNS